MTQNGNLDGIRGYLFAFCRERAPSADALFCTLLAKVRTTYRSALTKCVQITHIVPPVTVQPLAMWLSMHLIQNFFSLGTHFSSLCDPTWQCGRHPRPYTHSCMHRHMYTAAYRTVCYGWRVGIVESIVIVTATAAPDCDLILPYLNLT